MKESLCKSCRFRDADRHLIRKGENFAFCEKEGGFVVLKEHCRWYQKVKP